MPVSAEKQMRIERRAYALWQAEGQPDGRHEEHWRRAALEVEAEETASMAMRRKVPQAGVPRSGQGAAQSGGRLRRRAKRAGA
jgi:hypothetical protein